MVEVFGDIFIKIWYILVEGGVEFLVVNFRNLVIFENK